MTDRPGLAAMDPERWAKLETLFDQALDLPPREIPAFLDRACVADPSMRAELEALLRADESAKDFLESPAGEIASDLLAEPDGAASAWVGRRVGAWELMRELGRGGMGTVFLARRADGAFEQQAALKLIRPGLDSEEILVRFRRERQILARLEHPHIARLLDGGAAQDGTPYLVMERVEGEPITAWCRRARPSLEQLLRQFGQVCQAVQYAHQNLVVHRDLKPGNILVSSQGDVKLVDFGVARLLDPEVDLGLDRTSGERRMTPHYAAPEQIRGESPSTATDVYGLGVVLYELLCGVRPWEATRSSHDLERAILDATPEPPSRVATRPRADRGMPAWAARLRGDLDEIVLKAMRKEPHERYASVQSLAEDIERFLAGLPVYALRGTWRYRAGKFVRRHRTAVAVAGVAVLALIGGVAAVLWQARLAAQSRDRAVLAARKADEINGFVLELLTAASPYGAPDPNLSAREIVANGESRVRSELAGEPEVQAQMFDVLGGIHREFEQFGKAESLVTEGLAIRRRIFGPRHALVAASLNSLGLVRMKRGDVAGADSVLRQSLAMRRHMADEDDAVLESLTSLAVALDEAGKTAEAESLDRVALAMAERLHGPDHSEVAQQLNNLGALLSQNGDIQEAVPMLERALAIRVADRPRHNDVAITAELLAQCSMKTGDLARADSLLIRALAIREAWLPPGHGDRARTYDLLARVAVERGRFARAESLYLQAIDIRRGALGPLHPETGVSLNNLAVLYYFVRDLDRAARTFEQVHAAWRASWGVDHTNTLTCYTNLAAVRREQGRYDESERMLRHALARRVALSGDSAVGTAQVTHNLALLLFQRRVRLEEAERLARHAIAVRERKVGPATPPVAASQEVLASLLREQGRREESLAAYRGALNICRTAFDKPNPATADVLVGLGRLQLMMGQARAAEPHLAEALEIRSKAYPPGDMRTGEAQVALGRCLAATDRMADAAPLIADGLTAMRRRPGRPDPLIRDGEVTLAQLPTDHAATAVTR